MVHHWYGRGCGGSTKIRYLTYVPKDLDKHECSLIDLEHSKPPAIKKDLSQDRKCNILFIMNNTSYVFLNLYSNTK